MSQNLESLVDSLSQLSVVDMAKLKEMLESKWGVTAAVAAAAPAAGAGEAASESTEFKVTLEGPVPADKKIGIIKVVREATGLGLKEAKDLVESAPKPIKEGATKDEANEVKKKIEAAGGQVDVK